MKKTIKFAGTAVGIAAGVFLLLQGAVLFYYYLSCMRLERIEVVKFGTAPCELTVPVKYIAYDTKIRGEYVPLHARTRVKYDIFCVPGKQVVRITLHRHLGCVFGCFMAMYQVTDPEIREKLTELWEIETGKSAKKR